MNSGHFKDCINDNICNRLYRINHSCVNAGGKSAGLGAISGIADTYWGLNKGRSMEGALVKSTKFLAILFIVLAAVLNLKVFA